MKQKNLNGALQNVAAKFCAYLVRPHFVLYFVLGILSAISGSHVWYADISGEQTVSFGLCRAANVPYSFHTRAAFLRAFL